MEDLDYATIIAKEAGLRLLSLRTRAGELGLDHQALKSAGDAESQEYLDQALRDRNPSDAILSEEAVDNKLRLDAQRVWIIDPLDGTREYSEFRDDWAVHVALWERGALTAGAVALPGLGIVMNSESKSKALPELDGRPIRIAVSRTRPPALVEKIAKQLDAELIPMGSAGYKVCSVARGETDAYIHAGGQYEWDSAAPVAVASGAGLHTSRIDGSDLEYNRENPYLPDLLVCRQELQVILLSAIRNCS